MKITALQFTLRAPRPYGLFFPASQIVTEKSSPRESNGTSLLVCQLIAENAGERCERSRPKTPAKTFNKEKKMSLASFKAIALYQLCNGGTMDFK